MGQQGTVTITGFVGGDPTRFGREGGSAACSFRVGSTRSYFHAASGEWREHPTTWMTIKAFRSLAEHILGSLHTGDPVIVTGLLGTETWKQDGNARSRVVIEATSVGHDLVHGVSAFMKSRDTRGQSRAAHVSSVSDERDMPDTDSGVVFDDARRDMASEVGSGQHVVNEIIDDQTIGDATDAMTDVTAQTPVVRSDESQEFASAGF